VAETAAEAAAADAPRVLRGVLGSGADDAPPPKPHTANTGFCAECDAYVRAALADQFGYKVSTLVLDAATVKPRTLAEVGAAAHALAIESAHTREQRVRFDTFRRYEPNEFARPREANNAAKAARVLEKAIAATAAQRMPAARAAAKKAIETWDSMRFDEPARAIARRVLPDDKWIEDFDYEAGHLFYYNVATGARQWTKPPVQPWHVADGRFVPLAPPKPFPETNRGELDAHRAEQERMRLATGRAAAIVRVHTARKAGAAPPSLAGQDVGPASARVVLGSVRVSQAHGADEEASAADMWRSRALALRGPNPNAALDAPE